MSGAASRADCALLRTTGELRSWRAAARGPVGLIPTMGALHEGHAALLRRARGDCGSVVATIFVNPLQFDRAEDLARYPRSLKADLALCAAAGADAVYAPEPGDVYPAGFATTVEPGPAAALFEGASRPGHFRGVLTVVLKMLQRARPERAYFGEKDAQQLFLIRLMAQDLDLPVEIVGCATVREADGVALSSRNRRLAPAQRADAPVLWRALQAARAAFAAGARDPAGLIAAMEAVYAAAPEAVRRDYCAIVDDRDFAPARADRPGPWRAVTAAFVHGVRLIDNAPLEA